MSGMVAVNQIAAESVSGGDEATASLIATALGLIHVLQVYTSVCTRGQSVHRRLLTYDAPPPGHGPSFTQTVGFRLTNRKIGRCSRLGLANVSQKYAYFSAIIFWDLSLIN